jgi:hypothetical protein
MPNGTWQGGVRVPLLARWPGKTKASAPKSYFYCDASELTAVRVGNWKMSIGAKKGAGGTGVLLSRRAVPV